MTATGENDETALPPPDNARMSAGRSHRKKEDGEGGKHADRREIGGPRGPEPTRYGDWEVGGRCTDF